MTGVGPGTFAQLSAFVKDLAPGLELQMEQVDMFDSTVLRVGLRVDGNATLTNHAVLQGGDEYVAGAVAKLVADVQKEAVTAIGLESYVREREVAVLNRMQERFAAKLEEWGADLPDPDAHKGAAAPRLLDESLRETLNELGAP